MQPEKLCIRYTIKAQSQLACPDSEISVVITSYEVTKHKCLLQATVFLREKRVLNIRDFVQIREVVYYF